MRKDAQQTEIFVILGHFLLSDPLNNLKNQNFEKMRKSLEILSLYTCKIWFLIYGVQQTIFCH